MKARATVVAEPDGMGGTRLASLRSEAPMVLRPTPTGVYLVGGAAGPIGGDRLVLDIDVRAGAGLTMRSSAASLVFPGPGPSVVEVRARVAYGASLGWLVEPLVAVRECRHQVQARVHVETGGRLLWREELVLGRHQEEGGSVVSRMSLDVGGHPVLRHELAFGPGPGSWSSAAVGAGARSAGSLVIVDPSWADAPPSAAALGPRAALLSLSGPAVQVTALADDARALRALLDRGLEACGAGWQEASHEAGGKRQENDHPATTVA